MDLNLVDQSGLDTLVDLMSEDNKFQKQELGRFESLLSSVGTKYGGEKFEALEQVHILMSVLIMLTMFW